MPLLEIRNVTKRFDNFVAVDNVSISVKTAEFFTLLGPSGCGKTSLLRMIAGFDTPDTGQILLDGKDIIGMPPEKRPFHTVFQSYALFPHMTVADNVAFPLRMSGKESAQIKINVREALEDVHLAKFANRFPHELSGGQKQRVALARGLINRPRLLLLDEPLGALDEKLREEMQMELINLQKAVGITFVFITHSQNEALALSHRIAVMNHGAVEQIDAPSRIYSCPANRFIANFIGKINLINAQVSEVSDVNLTLVVDGLGSVTVPYKEGVKVNDEGVMAIRPEQIRIARYDENESSISHCMGKVQDFLYIGDVTTYIVELTNGTRLEALLPNSTPGLANLFEINDTVIVSWQHNSAQFLKN